jgi:hypothetical protein
VLLLGSLSLVVAGAALAGTGARASAAVYLNAA